MRPGYTAAMDENDAIELKRLRWQCRRGMREMDMLLERWLARHFASANAVQRQQFAQLLLTEDDLLWSWIMEKNLPDDEALVELLEQIRNAFDAVP